MENHEANLQEGISALGAETMALIEKLEAEVESGAIREPRIGAVAIVFEIDYVDEDGDRCNGIDFRSSDPRRWVQQGMFTSAARIAIKPDAPA